MATLPNNPDGPIYGTNGDDSGSNALVGTFAYSDTIYGQSGNDELLIMGQFGGVWAGRVIQGSGMSGAP